MSGYNEPRREPLWRAPPRCPVCGFDVLHGQVQVKLPWTKYDGERVAHAACAARHEIVNPR